MRVVDNFINKWSSVSRRLVPLSDALTFTPSLAQAAAYTPTIGKTGDYGHRAPWTSVFFGKVQLSNFDNGSSPLDMNAFELFFFSAEILVVMYRPTWRHVQDIVK